MTASASRTSAAVARSWHTSGSEPSNPGVAGWQAMSPTATTTSSSGGDAEGPADGDGDAEDDVAGFGGLGDAGGSSDPEHAATRCGEHQRVGAEDLDHPTSTTRRALEDLTAHGLLARSKQAEGTPTFGRRLIGRASAGKPWRSSRPTSSTSSGDSRPCGPSTAARSRASGSPP